jgi:Tol biopolymer transport system component/serine/threonine protein kinase
MPERDRWRRVEEIFHAALQCSADERPAFLTHACAGDDNLRREVESLLAYDRTGGDALASPALGAAYGYPQDIHRSLAGQVLGSYQIAGRIGSGGMGEVYLAQDLRLSRRVAVKIIAPEIAQDASWRARFAQEAKAASALNHPNIITVYDVGTEDGRDFLVMEYVDGPTLEQAIAGGPMPIPQAVRLATQIADAVATAHSAGIVHRDLKPANVLITQSGLAKVLDFGIAKLVRCEQQSVENRTLAPRTIRGALLGTVSYMSPEQAEGLPLDGRSDVFSFGSVLYEMLTGEKAFAGESAASVVAAVLHGEPRSLSQWRPSVPRELERIIERCLHKEPARRFQTMQEVKIGLDQMRQQAAPEPRLRRRVLYAAGALLVAGAFAFLWLHQPADPQFSTPVPLTAEMGDEMSPDFSPDGKQIVFVGAREEANGLFVQMTNSNARLQLTQTAERVEWSPAWSPDGRSIAFLRGGTTGPQLLSIPPIGGPVRKIAEGTCAGYGLSWSPDSRWLACSGPAGAGLSLVSADSGESRRLTRIAKDAQDRAPSFRPGGDSLLFIRCAAVTDCDLYLLSLDAHLNARGEPRRVTSQHQFMAAASWTSDGREAIFQSLWPHSSLYRVPVFGSGRPRQLSFTGPGVATPAVSQRTGCLVYAKEESDVNILRIEGGITERHPVSSTRADVNPALSPDGKQIAFASDRSGTFQVWLANADGSQPVRLTDLGEHSASPRWSPDGHWIAFDSQEKGRWDVWIAPAEGGAPRRVTNHPADEDEPSFSRDGKWIYFNSTRTGRVEVFRVSIDGGKEEQITTGGGSFAQEAPDGKTIYYALTQSPISALMEVPVTGGKGRPLEITFGGRGFAVAPDGIYFIAAREPIIDTSGWLRYPAPPIRGGPPADRSGSSLTRSYDVIQFYDFSTRTTREVHRLRNHRRLGRRLSVSPDRKTFLYAADEGTGWDLMLVEDFR